MSYSSAVLADSPLAYYRLGETSGTTMVDSSGNGRNGLHVSSPTLGATGLLVGDSDKAVTYGTGADLSRTPYAAWMDTPNGSLECWFATTTPTTQSVVGRWSSNPLEWIFIDFTPTAIRAYCSIGATDYVAQTSTNVGAMRDGNPHHVVATHDGSTLRLYVDGAQVASVAAVGNLNGGNADIYIGTRQTSGTHFTGTIDEVAIYGTALSAARVAAHYTAGTTAPPPSSTSTISATRLARTAAFASATVLASTMSANVPARTVAFVSETVAVSTMSAVRQARTAAFASDVVPESYTSTIAAVRQPRVADFSSSTVADSTIAATRLTRTAAFTSEAVIEGPTSAIDAVRQPRTATFVSATVQGRFSEIAAIRQARTATFTSRTTIPVAPVPAHLRQLGPAPVVVARALGPVTAMAGPNGTQPVYAVSKASKQRGRQQIIVDGVDISFLRDVRTPDVTYTLLTPLRYGPGQLDLPQIMACMEPLAEDDPARAADLAWMREGAPVEVHLVLDEPTGIEAPQVVVRDVYKGVLVAWDIDGSGLSIELGGEANGRAALRDRQDVIFPRVNDIGHQISDAVRDLGLPVYPPLGTVTGIEVMTTGGVGHLEHIQNLCAQAWTRQGKYWTVMPNDAGAYMVQRKSDSVRHATVYFDDARTVPRLRRDLAEEPNRIFITGVTPQGQRVRFGVYPGLIQGPVPDFPGHLDEGDTGEGVRLLTGKLHAVGYLKLVEVAGGYDQDVVEAVKDLQGDAGLPKTGEVNLATWEALYDLNVTTTSLEGAHIEPAAQASVVRRWNRSGSGTILEFNDGYDPEVLPVDRTIDAGAGKTRSQLREFARTVLDAASSPNWVGDIVFHTGGLVSGEHGLGAAITTADVLDARELIPTMNLWAPGFDGGTQFNVSALQVAEDGTVTATVDTRFRDALEVWDIIDRNRESRNDPARRRNLRHRSSTIRKDSIGEWDEIGGRLGHDVRLESGWNSFEVVGAMEGTIARLKVVLDDPAEFVVAVFGRKVDPGWLYDHLGDPLEAGAAKRWQTRHDALDDRWLLYSAGTPDEPCGYHPGRKADDDPITGRHVDDASWRYASESRTLLYVAVFVREANTIPLGRIIWPQLEAGA